MADTATKKRDPYGRDNAKAQQRARRSINTRAPVGPNTPDGAFDQAFKLATAADIQHLTDTAENAAAGAKTPAGAAAAGRLGRAVGELGGVVNAARGMTPEEVAHAAADLPKGPQETIQQALRSENQSRQAEGRLREYGDLNGSPMLQPAVQVAAMREGVPIGNMPVGFNWPARGAGALPHTASPVNPTALERADAAIAGAAIPQRTLYRGSLADRMRTLAQMGVVQPEAPEPVTRPWDERLNQQLRDDAEQSRKLGGAVGLSDAGGAATRQAALVARQLGRGLDPHAVNAQEINDVLDANATKSAANRAATLADRRQAVTDGAKLAAANRFRQMVPSQEQSSSPMYNPAASALFGWMLGGPEMARAFGMGAGEANSRAQEEAGSQRRFQATLDESKRHNMASEAATMAQLKATADAARRQHELAMGDINLRLKNHDISLAQAKAEAAAAQARHEEMMAQLQQQAAVGNRRATNEEAETQIKRDLADEQLGKSKGMNPFKRSLEAGLLTPEAHDLLAEELTHHNLPGRDSLRGGGMAPLSWFGWGGPEQMHDAVRNIVLPIIAKKAGVQPDSEEADTLFRQFWSHWSKFTRPTAA